MWRICACEQRRVPSLLKQTAEKETSAPRLKYGQKLTNPFKKEGKEHSEIKVLLKTANRELGVKIYYNSTHAESKQ